LGFAAGGPNEKFGFEVSVALVGVEVGVFGLFVVAVFPKENDGLAVAGTAPPKGDEGEELVELVAPNANVGFAAGAGEAPPPKVPVGAANENDGLLAPAEAFDAAPKPLFGAGEAGAAEGAPLPNEDAVGLEGLGVEEIPKLNAGGFCASVGFVSLLKALPKVFDGVVTDGNAEGPGNPLNPEPLLLAPVSTFGCGCDAPLVTPNPNLGAEACDI